MIYDIKKVKQLKLVTGEEILCEILEEDDVDVIIRNALLIRFHEMEDGSRLYTFNLFMCYQDDPDRFILLKLDKLVSVANPTDSLLEQYVGVTEKIFTNEVENISDEDYDRHFFETYATDSDATNDIKFPTFH